MRNTFSTDPVSPQQPQAAYYVLRTLSTVLEGARPSEMLVEFSNSEMKFDSYSFRLPEESRLVAFWLPGDGGDEAPDSKSDVIISDLKCKVVLNRFLDYFSDRSNAKNISPDDLNDFMAHLKG